MEKFKKTIEIKENNIDSARMEISELKKEEMTKKEDWLKRGKEGDNYDVQFDDIDPSLLTEKELALYLSYKESLGNKNSDFDRELKKEFLKIQNEDSKGMREHPEDKGWQSREVFMEYLLNKLEQSHTRKQLEEEEELRLEIGEMVAGEIKNKNNSEKYNPALIVVDQKLLRGSDLEIYKRFKNKTLTKDEFLEYEKEIIDEKNSNPEDPIAISRDNFQAYLSNKISLLNNLK